MRHCVKFSVPQLPSNSPWKGFPHNFHALIWATCSRRNFAQMTERCSWALLITLQLIPGLFAKVAFSQTLRASVGGVWKPPNAWFSAPAVGSKPIFFPKCWPIKELTRVWKLSLCARASDHNYDISCFPIGTKANGDSSCTRFLRLWSLLDFASG